MGDREIAENVTQNFNIVAERVCVSEESRVCATHRVCGSEFKAESVIETNCICG